MTCLVAFMLSSYVFHQVCGSTQLLTIVEDFKSPDSASYKWTNNASYTSNPMSYWARSWNARSQAVNSHFGPSPYPRKSSWQKKGPDSHGVDVFPFSDNDLNLENTFALLTSKFSLQEIGHEMVVEVTYWMSRPPYYRALADIPTGLSLNTYRYNENTNEDEYREVFWFNKYGEDWTTVAVHLQVPDPSNTRLFFRGRNSDSMSRVAISKIIVKGFGEQPTLLGPSHSSFERSPETNSSTSDPAESSVDTTDALTTHSALPTPQDPEIVEDFKSLDSALDKWSTNASYASDPKHYWIRSWNDSNSTVDVEYFGPSGYTKSSWRKGPHSLGYVEVIPRPDDHSSLAFLTSKFRMKYQELEVEVTYWMSRPTQDQHIGETEPLLDLCTYRFNAKSNQDEYERIYWFYKSTEDWTTVVIPLHITDPSNTRLIFRGRRPFMSSRVAISKIIVRGLHKPPTQRLPYVRSPETDSSATDARETSITEIVEDFESPASKKWITNSKNWLYLIPRESQSPHSLGYVELIAPLRESSPSFLNSSFSLQDLGHDLKVEVTYWMTPILCRSCAKSNPKLWLYTYRYNSTTNAEEIETIYRIKRFTKNQWLTVAIPLNVTDPNNTRIVFRGVMTEKSSRLAISKIIVRGPPAGSLETDSSTIDPTETTIESLPTLFPAMNPEGRFRGLSPKLLDTVYTPVDHTASSVDTTHVSLPILLSTLCIVFSFFKSLYRVH